LVLNGNLVFASTSLPGAWSSKFPPTPGANRPVEAMASDGTNLYVGGRFHEIGGVLARRLAKFDGSSWSELAEVKNWIAVLLVHGTNLYVGGNFYEIGGIAAANVAKWDGHRWEALGAGVTASNQWINYPASVSALYHDGTNLYVGGTFQRAGQASATNIARWDGQNWHALAGGLGIPPSTNQYNANLGRVSAIVSDGRNLYAGGQFIVPGPNEFINLARWDGSAWHTMGFASSGAYSFTYQDRVIYGSVKALAVRQHPTAPTLYIGGDFAGAFRRDGLTPIYFDTYPPPQVNAILVKDSETFVGGHFGYSGGSNLLVAGFTWMGVRTPMSGRGIFSICSVGDRTYVGGDFVLEDGTAAYIAELKGGRLTGIQPHVGNGLSTGGQNLVTDGTNVFISGLFEWAGTNHMWSSGIAKWDGAKWSKIAHVPMESSSYAHSLAVVGTNVFVGGMFTIADTGVTNLGRWDGERWKPVGLAANRPTSVDSMIAVGSRLFVAQPYGPCKWLEGTNWNDVPWVTEPYWIDQELASSGGDLYMARRFDDQSVKIARWTGRGLIEIPNNLSFRDIIGLAVVGADVFIAGWRDIPTPPVFLLYRWDGASWSELINSPSTYITDIASFQDKLVVLGKFTSIGGVAANNIAVCNDGEWRPLDSGISSISPWAGVRSALGVGNRLFVTGAFGKAGPNPSGNFAVWHSASDVQLRADQANLQINGGVGDHVQVESSTDLTTWSPLIDLSISNSTEQIPHNSSSNRFYRAKILEP
jgi:trimeric autotransporter adhesin